MNLRLNFKLGNARIMFNSVAAQTHITLNSGHELVTPWKPKHGDRERALELGYENAWCMNRDHDAIHVFVGHVMGWPDSKALTYAATGNRVDGWQYEEDIVFAIQKYLGHNNLTAVEVLKRYADAE